MTAVALRQPITPADRLGLTLCLAMLLHGIMILGVTFKPEQVTPPKYETMEIILVQQQSAPAEEARLLAQAHLEGGGESAERISPATPLPAPFPDEQPALTAAPAQEIPPESKAPPETQQTTPAPVPEPAPAAVEKRLVAEKEQAPEPSADAVEKLSEAQSSTEQLSPQPDSGETVPEPTTAQEQNLPDATSLLANSFRIAALNAEIRRKLEAQSQRPRRKFISASTREYKYAAYMEAWRAKVERVGNLNYPDEARRKRLTGSLILDVALNADGSINQITVRRSSGSKILDDAAINIVNLSSPFAPFPEQIRKETDILHITRTWQFLNNIRFK